MHQVRIAILVRRKRQKKAVRVALVQIFRTDVSAPLKTADEIYFGGQGAEGVFHLLDLFRRRAVGELEEDKVAQKLFVCGIGGNDCGEKESDGDEYGGEKRFGGMEFENGGGHCWRLQYEREKLAEGMSRLQLRAARNGGGHLKVTLQDCYNSGERVEDYDGLVGAEHNGFGDGDEFLLLVENAKTGRAGSTGIELGSRTRRGFRAAGPEL
jgi:hypothetical protein